VDVSLPDIGVARGALIAMTPASANLANVNGADKHFVSVSAVAISTAAAIASLTIANPTADAISTVVTATKSPSV
jgi:hypothetical protein